MPERVLVDQTALDGKANKGDFRVNVRDFGAVGDGRRVADGAMTGGSATLTSATASFSANDVGKRVVVWNAGTTTGSYTTGVAQQHDTTISAYVNATTVTLAAAAVTTVSATRVTIATDDSVAVNAAISTLSKGKELHFPATSGFYFIRNRIILPADGITVSATSKAVELHMSNLANPVPCVDALNRNDITVRDITFVSEDGHIWTTTGANAGSNYRGDGQVINHTAVWCNADRLTVRNVHSVDFENTVYLSAWNSALSSFAQDGRRADCLLENVSSVDQFCTVLAVSTVRLRARNLSKVGYVSAYAAPGHALYHSGFGTAGTNYPNGLFSTDLIAENLSMVDDVTSGGGTLSLKFVRGGRVTNIYARNNGILYSTQLDRVKISNLLGVDMHLYSKDVGGQTFCCIESANDVFGSTRDVELDNVQLNIAPGHASGAATTAFFHGDKLRIRDLTINTYRDSAISTTQFREVDFWGTDIKVKNLRILNLAANNGGTSMWPLLVGHPDYPTDVDIDGLTLDNWAYAARVYNTITDLRLRYDPSGITNVDRRATSPAYSALAGVSSKTRLQLAPYTRTFNISAASQTVYPSPFLETVTQINATTNDAFTIGAPSVDAKPYPGTTHEVLITNATAGPLGTITWNSAWVLRTALVSPPAGESHSITFAFNGTTWREVRRSSGAVVDTAASLTSLASNALSTGELNMQRDSITANNISPVSGTLLLTYFTPDKSEAITTLTAYTGSVAAGATPTLCRMGVYSVAANGDLTLVADTPNDTTLFGVSNTPAPKALSTTWNKVAGQRYATGILVVSAAAMPTFHGTQFPGTNVMNTVTRLSPATTGRITGQTDLPASITAASLVGIQSKITMYMS